MRLRRWDGIKQIEKGPFDKETLTEGKGSVRLTSLYQQLVCISSFLHRKDYSPFYKARYPNEEVNGTEPSSLVSGP